MLHRFHVSPKEEIVHLCREKKAQLKHTESNAESKYSKQTRVDLCAFHQSSCILNFCISFPQKGFTTEPVTKSKGKMICTGSDKTAGTINRVISGIHVLYEEGARNVHRRQSSPI
jgi:hypothetical protein